MTTRWCISAVKSAMRWLRAHAKQFGIDAEVVPEVLAQVGTLAGDGLAFAKARLDRSTPAA